VDQTLRVLFERALDDEPVPPPGDLAQEAMAHGARLRRRRGLLVGGSAAGVLALLATVVALNMTAPRRDGDRLRDRLPADDDRPAADADRPRPTGQSSRAAAPRPSSVPR
jgi:hypothetical protein